MSGVIKINKSSLDSSIVSFSDKVKEIEDDVTNVSNVLASIPAHDDFPNLTSKASMVARSLANVHLDLNHMSKNLKNYIEIMYGIENPNEGIFIEGCISRKKNIVPLVMNIFDN